MAIEFSLSCPQGGQGEEGHQSGMASQSPEISAKIAEWILSSGNPSVPKIFKLSAAVTFIEQIVQEIQKVFKKYPNSKAGITLSNSFPVMDFKGPLVTGGSWSKGVVYGMAGEGVLPITYLTLAKVAPLGVEISGNGGAINHHHAAQFLALGCNTVQVSRV